MISVDVQLRIDLAREIFRESGDLSISKFPAILEFAESLADVLNLEEGETEPRQLPLFVKHRETISVPARRKK